ncbi:hypothetical protein ABC855_g818 [[Candida] zeylanoides]
MGPKVTEAMQFRENRLETFENGAFQGKSKQMRYWTHTQPSPEVLADHGFYFTPTRIHVDQVTCACCRKKETNVGGVANIAAHHLEAHPDCALATIISSQLAHLSSDLESRQYWRTQSPASLQQPQAPRAVSLRRKTFASHWKFDGGDGRATSRALAEAGFYYCPLRYGNDRVQCVYCNCSLDTWSPKDDPIVEHRTNASGYCYFLEELEAGAKAPARPRLQRRTKVKSEAANGPSTKAKGSAKGRSVEESVSSDEEEEADAQRGAHVGKREESVSNSGSEEEQEEEQKDEGEQRQEDEIKEEKERQEKEEEEEKQEEEKQTESSEEDCFSEEKSAEWGPQETEDETEGNETEEVAPVKASKKVVETASAEKASAKKNDERFVEEEHTAASVVSRRTRSTRAKATQPVGPARDRARAPQRAKPSVADNAPQLEPEASFDEERLLQVIQSPRKSKKIRIRGHNAPQSPPSFHDISNHNLGDYDEDKIEFLEQAVGTVRSKSPEASNVIKPNKGPGNRTVLPVGKPPVPASPPPANEGHFLDMSSVFNDDGEFDVNVVIRKQATRQGARKGDSQKTPQAPEAGAEESDVFVDAPNGTENILDELVEDGGVVAAAEEVGVGSAKAEEKARVRAGSENDAEEAEASDAASGHSSQAVDIGEVDAQAAAGSRSYEAKVEVAEVEADVESGDAGAGTEPEDQAAQVGDAEAKADEEVGDAEAKADEEVGDAGEAEPKVQSAEVEEGAEPEESAAEAREEANKVKDVAAEAEEAAKTVSPGQPEPPQESADMTTSTPRQVEAAVRTSHFSIETPSKRPLEDLAAMHSSRFKSSPRAIFTSPMHSPAKRRRVHASGDFGDFYDASTPHKEAGRVEATTAAAKANAGGWQKASFARVLEGLSNMETASEYLHCLATSQYELNDDYDGELTMFISNMPEEEEDMTLQQWIRANASNCRKLLVQVCSEMIDAYRQECARALAVLEQLPTRDV